MMRDKKTLKRTTRLKSNVDVFLTSDMLSTAFDTSKKTHIIIVSCDGDYAEAIKNALSHNKNLYISVLATPKMRDFKKNALSVRLSSLYHEVDNFDLLNIANITDRIKK